MADFDALTSAPLQTESARPRRRAPRWLRIAFWMLLTLVVVAVLLVGACVLWLRSATKAALPQLDGEVHLAGLSVPVTVRRDVHGVPHIEAATQDDLFVAQGYVTAQDRLWQMDTYRRNANGELAEVLGARLVPHDRAQRVLGFRKTAERIYAQLSGDDRRRLDDYARGVNLFIEQHQDNLPEEFRVLRYKPKPWAGVDSISVGTMMIDMLDSHWDVKVAREEISAKLGNPKLEEQLYPVGSWRDRPPTGEVIDLSQPHEEPAAAPDEDEEDRTQARRESSGAKAPLPLTRACGTTEAVPCYKGPVNLPELREMLGLPQCDGCAAGSNNWVISGAHTASGKPLLSNDMHLSLTEPNIWFMADLSAPGYHAAGVTLPGMPYVVAGHNEHVAWGFTALYADVQDLYHEKLDGKGNFEDLTGAWKPLIVDREVIHVRNGADVVVEVQSTDHGPLINPMFKRPLSGPVSLKWTLYDAALNNIPLYAMNAASNWSEFSAALKDWCWPTQNLVYADDQGHIAYHAIGRIPMRPGGLQGKPIAGAQHEWAGYMGFDDVPNAYDPPSGFLATANSRVTTDKSKYLLTLEWIDPYRVQRIYKLLQGRDKLTPKDMLAAQTDIYSEVDQELAHRFAYAIDHAANTDERLRRAADLLRSWDGKLTTDSAAASIVDQARYALWPIILEPKLGEDFIDYRWGEKDFAEEEIIMHGGTDWMPPGYKDWDTVLTEAVRKGMERGSAPADVRDWKYGNWHVVDIEHPLGAMLPVIGSVAGTGRKPMSGDTTTVKQVSQTLGPSQRFTMDWSDVDGSTENIVLGESGNPYSAYFRDQWDAWYGGSTFAMPFHEQAVAAGTTHTLRLLP